MDQEIKKFKIYFSKHLQTNKDYTSKLNKYFNLIISYIKANYKHIDNVMHCSLMFYIFLVDKEKLLKYSTSDIKKLFYLENIIKNSFCTDAYDSSEEEECNNEKNFVYDTISINTNVNLLNYHPLVVSNLDKKDKLLKIIVNKLSLAIKIDIFNRTRPFVDYYEIIQNSLKTQKSTKNKVEIKRETHRGGFKKKMKSFKKILSKKNL